MPTFFVDASVASSGDGSTGSPYKTIAEALSASASGDTVLVRDGTYNENLVITHPVVLESENGRNSTTIVGSSSGGTLGTIEVDPGVNNVTIGILGQGFTIKGFDSPDPGIEYASVYLQGAHDGFTLQDNNVVADGEVGLLSEFGSPITNALIDSNTFSGKSFTGATPAGSGSSQQFTLANVPRPLVFLGSNNVAAGQASTNITFTNNDVTGTAGGTNSNGNPQGNFLVSIDAAHSTVSDNTFSGFTLFNTQFRARENDTDVTNNVFSAEHGGNVGAQVEDDGTPGTISGNEFNGGDQANIIVTPAGSEKVNGGAGNDLIYASAGNDDIDGGPGTDTYDMALAGSGGSVVDLGSGSASSTATGFDTLASIENVRGSSGMDTLYGDNNDNVFYATAGNDTIDGRGGSDTFDATGAATPVFIDLNNGTVSGSVTAHLTSVENATGGSGDDVFVESSANNTFVGGAGKDTVSYGSHTVTADNISYSGTTWVVAVAGEGVDHLSGIEVVDGANAGKILLVGGGGYATIQSAIDASADGDTILIASGTYAEQLHIDGKTNLTLQGVSQSGVIITPPAGALNSYLESPYSGSDLSAVVSVENSSNVVIKSLTVNGAIRAADLGGASDYLGVGYVNATGGVDHVTVTGVRDADNAFGVQRGEAIYASYDPNSSTTPNDFFVRGSTVTNFQKTGILVFGADVDISGNTVTGVGATDKIAQNGVEIGDGATGSVSGNSITAIGYTVDNGYYSSGIFILGDNDFGDRPSTLTVTGNSINLAGSNTFVVGLFVEQNVDHQAVGAFGNSISNAAYGVDELVGNGNADGPLTDLDGPTNTQPNTYTNVPVNFIIEPISSDPITVGITREGTAGVDVLNGGDGNDNLNGLGGNDTVNGGAGNDVFRDSAGSDTYDGGADNDTLILLGTQADYTITQNNGTFIFAHGNDVETVRNVETFLYDGVEPPVGQNTQTATVEQDASRAALGIDAPTDANGPLIFTVTALPGQGIVYLGDTPLTQGQNLTAAQLEALVYDAPEKNPGTFGLQFSYTDGNDPAQALSVTLNVTGPVDNVKYGTAGVDRLDGAAGNDKLFGKAGNDHLIGGIGNDDLHGGRGSDLLEGGKGKDSLEGGKGKDLLIGGKGHDAFVFDTKLGHSNVDTISRFSSKDTIDLDHHIFKALEKGSLSGSSFHEGSHAHDSNDRIIYKSSTGELFYDKDGNGHASQVHFATLDKNLHLTHADFLVV